MLFVAFALTLRTLDRFALSRLERFSLLTSSILAYSLIAPGYSEVVVLALTIYALECKPGTVEKVLVAAMMIATHETATLVASLVLVLVADAEDRAEWAAILGLLYAAYVGAFLFAWRAGVLDALSRAGKPDAGSAESALGLAMSHPLGTVFGVLAAYKLYWIALAGALTRARTVPMAIAAFASVALTLFGTDTSRLVQFSSLAFLLAAGATLQRWPHRPRRVLAAANLLVPSLYVATNVTVGGALVPLWGHGLYEVYLRAAQRAGLEWGGQFGP